jgi:hypothetical protein
MMKKHERFGACTPQSGEQHLGFRVMLPIRQIPGGKLRHDGLHGGCQEVVAESSDPAHSSTALF